MQSRERSLDVRNTLPKRHAVADPSAACCVCAVRSAAANVSTASSGSRGSFCVADFMTGRRTTSSVVCSVRALSHTSAHHVTSGLWRVRGRRTDASDVRQASCCLSPVTPRSPRRRLTHALVIGQPRLAAGAGPCGAGGVARQRRVATRTSTDNFDSSWHEQQKSSVEVLAATRCRRLMPARIRPMSYCPQQAAGWVGGGVTLSYEYSSQSLFHHLSRSGWAKVVQTVVLEGLDKRVEMITALSERVGSVR